MDGLPPLQVTHCASFSIRELFIDGEWVHEVVDAELSGDPC